MVLLLNLAAMVAAQLAKPGQKAMPVALIAAMVVTLPILATALLIRPPPSLLLPLALELTGMAVSVSVEMAYIIVLVMAVLAVAAGMAVQVLYRIAPVMMTVAVAVGLDTSTLLLRHPNIPQVAC